MILDHSRKLQICARLGNCVFFKNKTEHALYCNACPVLKDQYGPRVFFLEFPFFAENMIIRSILNLWWHSEILKLILGAVRGMFTKRLKGTNLYMKLGFANSLMPHFAFYNETRNYTFLVVIR